MLSDHVCNEACTDTGTRWDHKPCPFCSTETDEWGHRMSDHCPSCMELTCIDPKLCARMFDQFFERLEKTLDDR